MAYNVSSAFREQCYSGSSLYKCRLIIGEETIPTSQIASITISSPIVDSENEIFYIGTFISQKLTIQFKNLDGINTKSGTGVELYISQYVNNNWEEVPIGKYIIDESPEDYYKSSKIECLDYAIKFATNLDYSPAFVDNKITIDNLLQWICNYYGVTLGSYPNTNGDVEIGTYDSTISGKRWISYIAELKGCNAKMDRLGQLTLVPLKSSPVVTIDAKKSKSWELGEKFEVSKVTYFDATRNYTFGDDTENTLILRQDNPFVVNEQVVRNIYENLRLASSMVEENTDFTLENTVEGEPIGSLSLKGDTQQNTTILPSEYQQVEYIEGTGTQHIDTGFKPNQNTRTTISYYNNQDGTNFIFGARISYTSNNYALVNLGTAIRSDYNSTDATSYHFSPFAIGDKIIYDKNKNVDTVYKNGTLFGTHTFSTLTITPNQNMYLFTINDNGNANSNRAKIRLYYCKIYDNGTLVRDYIPCYRISDNVIGLYDLVNNVFYTNAGSGTFTKGNNVTLPTPDYPQEVKTVTGGQEINVTGKNMYDINNFSYAQQYQVTSSISNGIITTTPTSGTSSPWFITIKPEITVEPNQQYTLSFNVNGSLAKPRIYSVSPQGYYEFSGSISNNRYVGTITMPNNVTNIRLMFYYNQGTTTTISNIMFEKGNITNPTYEPPKSFTQEINLGVENLFDINGTIGYSNSGYTINNGVLTVPSSASNGGFLLYNTNYNGDNYTLSFNTLSGTPRALLRVLDSNGQIVQGLTIPNFSSYNGAYGGYWKDISNSNVNVIIPSEYNFRLGFVYTNWSVSNIQLEKGNNVNPYSEYGKEPIELCKIGDYQDYIYKDNGSWYIHKEIGKVVLDGSENWGVGLYGTNSYNLAKSDMLYTTQSIVVILSNLFKGVSYNDRTTGNNIIYPDVYESTIYIRNTSYASLANFKTFLASNNLIAYYVLATPTNTIITDTKLIEQLEHFEHNAKFYGGVTNINSTSPITFKLFTSDPFICYSLKTENYGDISLDSWDNITYTLGEETYNTLNNNTVTYEMTIMSKAETKIPTKQQEVTTNVVGGNVEQRVRRIGSEVNNLSGQVTILGEEIDETSESLAEFTLTTDASIQSLTQTTSNIASEEQTHYQEMLSKMDDKASISDIETITNQVNVLQTDTYTKTEINKILNGTDENGNVVSFLQTLSATLDENGMSYNKTGANTSSNINQAGVTVTNKKNNSELLFAGYDEQKLEALVRVANLYLTRFLGLDVWRIEIINDSTNGKGLGFFYIG